MERLRNILLGLPALTKFFFAILVAAAPVLADEQIAEDYTASVSSDRAVFSGFSANLSEAKNIKATLYLTFSANQDFSAEQVFLILNGLQCTASAKKMKTYADWERADGQWRLSVNLDSLKFGNEVAFLDKVLEVVGYRGQMTLDVRSPVHLVSAVLHLDYQVHLPPPPTVVITQVDPAGPLVQVPNVTFRFVSNDGGVAYECKERGHQWLPCTSPKTFSGLPDGRHHFKFRAIDRYGRLGPITHYRVLVDAPYPAVTITSVVPPENPTTSTSIEISFTKNGAGGDVQCKLDDRAFAYCASPVRYGNLMDGQHRVTFRRIHWIYQTVLGRWLSYFQWFRAFCPEYTDPVVYTWVIQRGVPSAEFVSTPAALSNDPAAHFEFKADGPAQFQCRLDSGADSACSSPVDLTVAEGNHLFEVTPYAGSLAGQTIAYRWEVDRTAPVLTAGTIVPAETVTNSASLSMRFTSSEPASFTCQIDGSAETTCVSPVQVSGLADGRHEIAIYGVDAAGNRSNALVYDWTVDLTAPGVTLHMTSPTALPTKQTSATFEFSATEAASFLCSLDGSPRVDCVSPVVESGLEEGQHEFQVAAVDGAGNVGNASSVAWEIDRTAPQITLGTITPPENPTQSHSMEIAFDVSEASEVFCELDAGGQVPCHSPFTAANVADGSHAVEILAVDAAGNVSAPARYEWRVDSIAVVAITSVSPDGSIVGSSSMRFEFGSTNSTQFLCTLDNGAAQACVSPVLLTDLSDGVHHWEVRGLNLAGQAGPAAAHDWTVDTVGPVVTIDSVSPAISPTSSMTFAVSFSSSDAVTFLCTVDEAAESACLSPMEIADLADGAHQISIRGVDSLGNIGNPTVQAWSVDTTGPALAFGAINPAGSQVSALTLSAEVTANEPASLFCSLDGAVESACESPVTVDVGEGDHTLVVVGVDLLGNRGNSISHAWSVAVPDVAAEITSFSPVNSPSVSRSATFEFSATGATGFVCSLDGAAFAPCTSPAAFDNLADGSHSFAVKALNLVNRPGPAATHGWLVDGTGPVVQILATTPSESPTSALALTAYFSADETASFFCSLDGAQEVACSSPYMVSVGEGSHRLAIAGVDALGNRGAAAQYVWSVAVPEAVASILATQPASSPTKVRSFSASFDGTNAVSFECSLDGAAFAACVSPFSVQNLADGSHVFQVRGVNAVGRSGAVAAYSWLIDNVGPDVVLGTISPSVSPTALNYLTAAFSVAESGASFLCSLDGNAEFACTSPHLFSNLSDGAHQFTVVALDSLGNRGNSANHAWSVDTTGPVVSFGAITPAGSPTSSLTLSASFSANEPATFLCSLDGGAESACSSPKTVSVGEGSHTLAVVGIDTLGNRGAAAVYSWTVAVPDAVAQIDSFSPSVSPTSSRSASASFSAANASGFVCSLDGSAFSACTSPVAYFNLSEGSHSFSVAALNSVGKRGPAASRSWVIDLTGPVTTITSTSPSTSPTSSLSLIANFSANESASFLCSLDGAAESACSSPLTVSVGQGAHTLAIAGVDAVGNRGAAATYSWTVQVPPATVAFTSFSPSTAATQSRSFSASFEGTNAVSFECSLDGAAFAACTSPFSGSGLADGSHTVQVRGVNAVGQVGTAISQSWLVDNVGPTTTLLSTTPDWSPTSQITLTATFQADEAGATFLCRLDSGTELACSSPYTVAGLADGTHVIYITGLDALGNRGNTVSYTWIVDSTALAISNVSVMNVTSNSARIEWTTNFDSTSQVKYGTGSNLNQSTAVNGTFVKTHSMTLTGLASFTFYSAQAVSVDRDGRTIQSNVVTFRTLRP